jgi:hypothetical protein
MSATTTTLAAILKEHYPFQEVRESGYRKNKFTALIQKRTDAGGEQEKIAVDFGANQAGSYTFTNAQTLAAALSSNKRAFEVVTTQKYQIAHLSGKIIRATMGNAHAFIKAVDSEIRGAFAGCARDDERDLFRDGTGFIGEFASESTVTMTLANAWQAHCIEYGMELGAAADGASAIRSGTTTVTGVNRADGTIVSDATWSTAITSLTAGDKFFRVGDYTAANDLNKIYGLEAWCPATAPTSGDSHFGVDRSVDVERLAGIRYDGSSDTVEEAFINGQSQGSANGALPNVCWASNYNVRRLVNTMTTKVRYDKMAAVGTGGKAIAGHLGFRTIVIDGDEGEINVIANPLVPYDVAWCVDMSKLYLFSMGVYPDTLAEDDGGNMLRVYNADTYELRVGGYPQMACSDPSSIVRIKLA